VTISRFYCINILPILSELEIYGIRSMNIVILYFSETLHGEFLILRSIHGSDAFTKHVTYQRFRQAWYKFIALLQLDNFITFQCNICRDEPDIVLMDATSLSVRKHLLPWSNYYTNVSPESQISRRYIFSQILLEIYYVFFLFTI
jgi:hypothetical protein